MNRAVKIKKAYVLYSGVVHPLQQGVLKAWRKGAKGKRRGLKAAGSPRGAPGRGDGKGPGAGTSG